MALINCEKCGKEISDKASACPHCAVPVIVEQIIPKRVLSIAEERERIYTLPENERKIAQAELEERIASENKSGMTMVVVVSLIIVLIVYSCSGSHNDNTSAGQAQAVIADNIDSKFIGDEHIGLKDVIKKSMHNPDSYEFVSGKRWENAGETFTELTYRGTNGFGGIVTERITAKLDSSGNIVTIMQ